jgi:eukaryotic-like serine/threonine-protein kinase
MATVYKARQLSLDRIVAVKVLPKKMSQNADFVQRFYKEGMAAARLSHHNMVQAIDVGSTPDNRHYFVMEYIEGKSLYDLMAPPPAGEGRSFSEAEALDIIIQVGEALAHAHSRGLIHRDVKPKNIMLTPQGVAKLTDLGLARATDDKEAALSEQGKAYGTPYYISPEQIRGDVDIDYRADIYSLGATFYHLVTGRPPFEGDSPADVMHKHLKQVLVPADHVNTALSTGVGEIIDVAMAKRKEERYASMEQMLEDLRAVRQNKPPVHAHRAVDLDSLARIEETGKTVDILPPPGSTPISGIRPLVIPGRRRRFVSVLGNLFSRSNVQVVPSAQFRNRMDKQVAFIGMGIMGRAMAGSPARWRRPPHGPQPHHAKAADLIARGAKPAASPAEAAAGADVVFICVTDTPT